MYDDSENIDKLIEITNNLSNPFYERDILLSMVLDFPYPIWIKRVHVLDDGSFEFRMNWFSKKYEEIFNVSIEDYEGKLDADIWPASIHKESKINDLRAIQEGKIVTKQLMMSFGDDIGKACYWFVTKFSLKSGEIHTEDNQHYMYVVGFAIPFTIIFDSNIQENLENKENA